MRENLKRLLTFLVAASMVFSMMPMGVGAETADTDTTAADGGSTETLPVAVPEESTDTGTASAIESISVDPISIIEETNGYMHEGDDAFYYYQWGYKLSYTVYFSDGDSLWRSGYDSFTYNGETYTVATRDEQWNTHWTAGNTYDATLVLYDSQEQETCGTTTVTITGSPVQSIEFEPLSIIAGTGGYEYPEWNPETEENDLVYYRYAWWNSLSYTVTFTDGTSTSATGATSFWYNGVEYPFVYADPQSYASQWTAGNTYTFDMYAMGVSAQMSVTIARSPIESLVFSPVSMIEGTGGDLTQDWDQTTGTAYYRYGWQNNLSFTVTFTDGTSQTGTGAGISYNGSWYDFSYVDDQSCETPWTAGGAYTGTVKVLGYTASVPVTITESPVQSITVNPISIIENTGGIMTSHYPPMGGVQSYYCYQWWHQIPYTVTFTDGSSTTGTGSGFWCGDSWYSFSTNDSQGYEAQWTVGNTYYPTASAMGVTVTVPVTIVASPVASAVFQPVMVEENTNGHWSEYNGQQYWNYSDWINKLSYTITFTDGSTYTGMGWGFWYQGKYYSFSVSTTQSGENPWLAGNTYSATVSAMGKSWEIPVTVFRESQSSGYTYFLQGDKVIITDCSLTDAALQIPETLDGYPVVGITSLGAAVESATSIVIPDSVTMLSSNVFTANGGWYSKIPLEELTLGAGISTITVDMLRQAVKLQKITVAAANESYCSIDGVVYDKAVTTMVAYPPAKQSTHVIPDTVTDIEVIFDNGDLYSGISFQLGAGVDDYVEEDGIIYDAGKTKICYITGELTGTYVMPDTVTEVKEYAFANTDLTEVTVSKSVTEIAYAAFAGCTKLEKVNLPEGLVTIGGYAFGDCTALKSADIPSTVQNIYAEAYCGCTALEKVNITDLAAWCRIYFEWANANPLCHAGDLYLNGQLVEDLVLPTVVDKVYRYAFYNGNFRTVTVPAGIKAVGYDAFDSCDQLNEVHIEDLAAWCNIQFENESANPLYTGKNIFMNGEAVMALEIPDVVSKVYAYTFNNANISSVKVPSSVQRIDYRAFHGSDVNSAELSEGLVYIGSEAFQETSLTSLVLPDSLKNMGSKAFQDCTFLQSVTIGDGLVVIPERAFFNTGLLSVTVPKRVEYIGYQAFKDSDLKELDLQCDEVYIGDQAFMNCPLGDLEFEDNVGDIGWNAFYGTEATQVKLPASITSLSYRVFAYNENLVSVTIPENITYIEDFAFEGDDNLSHVLYTGTEDQWGKVECYSQEVNDATIHYEATGDEVTTELTCAKIRFYCTICQKWEAVNRKHAVHQFEGDVCTVCGHVGYWEYDKDETAGTVTVTGYTGTETELTVPKTIEGLTVTAIADNTFEGNTSITSVTIPDTVMVLGDGAFKGCSSLSQVTLSKKLTAIGDKTFYECDALLEIVIPEGVTAIGEMAFYDAGLVSVELPDTLTVIGDAAFEFCTELKSVVIPEGVTSIGTAAFYECVRMEEVTLPSTVTDIGYYTFFYCEGLTELTVPASVKTISPCSFEYCYGLDTIIFQGDAPEVINAFSGVGANAYYSAANTTWDTFSAETAGGDIAWIPCETPAITAQPVSVDVDAGESAAVSVEATGEQLTYQWYSAAPGSKKFEKTDLTEAEFSLTVDAANSGSRYYCVVTDILGQTARTKTATVKITPELTGIRIRRAPYTVEYDLRQELRTSGLEVVQTFSDDSELLITDYTVSGYDPNVGGEQTITVTHGDYTAAFTVTVNEEKVNYTSTEEKIEISVPENAVDSEAELVVQKVELEQEEITQIPEVIQQNESVVFDISFQKEEEVVQPTETVQVSIPVPETMHSKRCKVYHVADDGSTEDMNAVYKDGHMVFDTSHFSYYAVVEMAGVTVSGTVSGDDIFGVVVKLLSGGEVMETVELVNGTYTFENVVDNDYVIEVEKEDMTPKQYTITVGDMDYVLDILLAILGDIDGNESVNTDDVVQLLLHVSMPDVFEISAEADFTGDGLVNTDDVVQLLLHVSMPDVFPLEN